MIEISAVQARYQHIELPFSRSSSIICWATGIVDFTFSAAQHGGSYEDSLSILIGPRLQVMHTAIPMVTIGGVRFGTPTVSVLTEPVWSAGLSIASTGFAQENGGAVSLTGVTESFTIPALRASIPGVSYSWSVVENAGTFDETERHPRLTVRLRVEGNIDLTQLSYSVAIFGHHHPISLGVHDVVTFTKL